MNELVILYTTCCMIINSDLKSFGHYKHSYLSILSICHVMYPEFKPALHVLTVCSDKFTFFLVEKGNENEVRVDN